MASSYTAPEDRIGPNAAQWRAEEDEFLRSIGAKRDKPDDEHSDGDASTAPTKKQKLEAQKKKKRGAVVPIPYRRYIPDNSEFREFLYCYKHKEREQKRKQRQAAKKQSEAMKAAEGEEKTIEDDKAEEKTAKAKEEEDDVSGTFKVVSLRRVSVSICSFVVRVTMGHHAFPFKWAEDLAHVFGLPYAPVKDNISGESLSCTFVDIVQ